MKSTILRVSGRSSDGRTNKWRATCPECAKEFQPPTTLLATQGVRCPKYDAYSVAKYNDEPPTLTRKE